MYTLCARTTFALFFFTAISDSLAHGGATLKDGALKGCHAGKSDFHCHKKSAHDGKSWPSESIALTQTGDSAWKVVDRPVPGRAIYKRAEWDYPSDDDKDCLNTRHEILAARSLVEPVIEKCKVVSGKWDDFYFKEQLDSPKKIDIDHLVPLKHAADSGAAEWASEKKRSFANDPDNLVITNSRANRQKGANDLTSWLPRDRVYACRYFAQWMKVKEKYALVVSKAESDQGVLLNCDKQSSVEPVKAN